MTKYYKWARKGASWLISLFLGLIALLLLSIPLVKAITLFSWPDPWTRHSALNLLLLIGWLVLTVEGWIRLRPYPRWVRWGLTMGGAGFVMALNLYSQPFMKSDWERLKELGTVERIYDTEMTRYRALPIEEKLDIFLDVAHYVPTHPVEALKAMAWIIAEGGPEASDPMIWTIRAHLPHARAGDPYSKRVVYWLFNGLYWFSDRLYGWEAQSLVIDLLCDPRNEPLLMREDAEEIVRKHYPEIRPYSGIPDEKERWAKICEALRASGRWKPER